MKKKGHMGKLIDGTLVTIRDRVVYLRDMTWLFRGPIPRVRKGKSVRVLRKWEWG